MSTPGSTRRPASGPGRILMIVGLCILGTGLLLGFLPVSSSGVGCGSAFISSNDAYRAELTVSMGGLGPSGDVQGACDSIRQMTRIPAVVLIVLGFGLVIGGSVASLKEERTREQQPDPLRENLT